MRHGDRSLSRRFNSGTIAPRREEGTVRGEGSSWEVAGQSQRRAPSIDMARKTRLRYDPDESHRRKHHWTHPYAAIIEEDDGKRVGKCSSGIDMNTAQALLDSGVHYSTLRFRRKMHPEMVFNVFEGIPYKAHQMGSGSYHGFPVCRRDIPRNVLGDLTMLAEREGSEEALSRWLEENP